MNQTTQFSNPPAIVGHAAVVGKKEGNGPLGQSFDLISPDDKLGEASWEKSEIAFQKQALTLALDKAGQSASKLNYLLGGDLLNQCIATSFAARGQNVPFLGLYAACATLGAGLSLGGMLLDRGSGGLVGVTVSSHFCTAERQYRTPLEYGGQRTPTAQWTVTGAGGFVLSSQSNQPPYLTHCTLGKIIDKGITDVNNMGAAMAPAAYDTIKAHLEDTGRAPDYYDLIVTGDLGHLGRELLLELFRQDGIDLSKNHTDCGAMIFDPQEQDVHSGGSGCGCCGVVLGGYLLNGMREGQWNNILFCPTGALHSPTTAAQGESIPAICHAVAISNQKSSFYI